MFFLCIIFCSNKDEIDIYIYKLFSCEIYSILYVAYLPLLYNTIVKFTTSLRRLVFM